MNNVDCCGHSLIEVNFEDFLPSHWSSPSLRILRRVLTPVLIREYNDAIIRTVPDPLAILDSDLLVRSANEAFYRTFRLSPKEADGRSIFELSHGVWDIPGLRELLADIIPRNSFFDDFEVKQEFERIGQRTLLLNARTLLQPESKTRLVLLGIRDITGRTRAEESLRESEAEFQILADNIAQLAWTCDRLGDVIWYNKRWLDYTGLTFEEMKEWGWKKVQHPDHVDRVVAGVVRSQDTGEIWEDTFPLRGKDGNYRWFLSRAVPIRDAAGNVVRWFGTNTDITNERKADERQRLLMNELAHRGKNLLTVIQSIASRSLSGTRSLIEARDVLVNRIQALAQSQSALLNEGFEGAPIAEIIRLEFEGFSG